MTLSFKVLVVSQVKGCLWTCITLRGTLLVIQENWDVQATSGVFMCVMWWEKEGKVGLQILLLMWLCSWMLSWQRACLWLESIPLGVLVGTDGLPCFVLCLCVLFPAGRKEEGNCVSFQQPSVKLGIPQFKHLNRWIMETGDIWWVQVCAVHYSWASKVFAARILPDLSSVDPEL